jgi:hypothetical protein
MSNEVQAIVSVGSRSGLEAMTSNEHRTKAIELAAESTPTEARLLNIQAATFHAVMALVEENRERAELVQRAFANTPSTADRLQLPLLPWHPEQ